MLLAILDGSCYQKSQKWLPFQVGDNIFKLKVHPNCVVFGFCFKSLSLMEGPWQPFLCFLIMADIQWLTANNIIADQSCPPKVHWPKLQFWVKTFQFSNDQFNLTSIWPRILSIWHRVGYFMWVNVTWVSLIQRVTKVIFFTPRYFDFWSNSVTNTNNDINR